MAFRKVQGLISFLVSFRSRDPVEIAVKGSIAVIKRDVRAERVLISSLLRVKFSRATQYNFCTNVPLFTFTISKALPRDTASPDSAFFVLVEIIFGVAGKA
jgi:hypothetical protein